MAGMQVQKQFAKQEQQLQMAMQQSQMDPQATQQLQMQAQQMAVEKANAIAKIEADITTQLARDEEERTKREQQDPLVKLKQQEIDLRAAEVMSRQQDMQTKTVMDAARLDMDRDKIEADTTIKLMETANRIEDSAAKDALGNLKENISLTKEAMKNETTARVNGRRNNESEEN